MQIALLRLYIPASLGSVFTMLHWSPQRETITYHGGHISYQSKPGFSKAVRIQETWRKGLLSKRKGFSVLTCSSLVKFALFFWVLLGGHNWNQLWGGRDLGGGISKQRKKQKENYPLLFAYSPLKSSGISMKRVDLLLLSIQLLYLTIGLVVHLHANTNLIA